MKKETVIFLVILIFFANFLSSEEIYVDGGRVNDNESDYDQSYIGLTFSFSGFTGYKLGMGVCFLNIGREFGSDLGLLAEYSFEEKIRNMRFYYHLTRGGFSPLFGLSTVLTMDDNDLSIGFSPEIGFSISPLFQIFYRYNYYMDNKFSCHEIVFHLRKTYAVGNK